MDGLETFQPDGVARRILGMGDVLALIEKAESLIDPAEAERLTRKMTNEGLDFEDFLNHMRSMKSMGSFKDILSLLPGAQRLVPDIDEDDMRQQLAQSEAIISSMTKQERRTPQLLNGSRKRRIARGSGTAVEDVNRLLKEFRQLQKMMKKMGPLDRARSGSMRRGRRNLSLPQGRG